MTQPLVCAVMLTKDRPEMAKRAVECFRSQTYQNKVLCILDTSAEPEHSSGYFIEDHNFWTLAASERLRSQSIGFLRNHVAKWICSGPAPLPKILIHWDDDDWSHPNRIAEQVALLQASGKQAVGYRDMLFWRLCPQCNGFDDYCADVATCETCKRVGGQAWLYSSNDPRYCLGTSLCYWRETWERRPFPDISRGEDKAWLREVDSIGVSSIPAIDRAAMRDATSVLDYQPRMIASIHSGNHVVYEPEKHPHNWKRVPEWDAHCRKVMAL